MHSLSIKLNAAALFTEFRNLIYEGTLCVLSYSHEKSGPASCVLHCPCAAVNADAVFGTHVSVHTALGPTPMELKNTLLKSNAGGGNGGGGLGGGGDAGGLGGLGGGGRGGLGFGGGLGGPGGGLGLGGGGGGGRGGDGGDGGSGGGGGGLGGFGGFGGGDGGMVK